MQIHSINQIVERAQADHLCLGALSWGFQARHIIFHRKREWLGSATLSSRTSSVYPPIALAPMERKRAADSEATDAKAPPAKLGSEHIPTFDMI